MARKCDHTHNPLAPDLALASFKALLEGETLTCPALDAIADACAAHPTLLARVARLERLWRVLLEMDPATNDGDTYKQAARFIAREALDGPYTDEEEPDA